jgi:hypothetical protein
MHKVTPRVAMFAVYAVAVATMSFTALPSKAGDVRLWDERMTFTLPSDWTAIPKEIVARRNAEVEESLSKPYKVNFKHGYDITGTDWFSFPYILVKTGETHRVSEPSPQQVQTIDMRRAVDKIHELAPSALENLSFQKPTFDFGTHRTWMEAKFTKPNGDEGFALSMIQLTQEGTVEFSFYATAAQYVKLRPIFLEIASSVTPDPEIAYRPDGYNWEPILAAALKGFLIIGAFSLYRRFFGRPKQT